MAKTVPIKSFNSVYFGPQNVKTSGRALPEALEVLR
jgi:hypothetical protein